MIPQYNKKQIVASLVEPPDLNVIWLDISVGVGEIPYIKIYKEGVWVTINTDNTDIATLQETLDAMSNMITTGVIQLNTNSTIVTSPRQIRWNEADGTFDMILLNGVTLQSGQELHFYGKVSTAGNIANGDVVMYVGSQGDHLLFAKATQEALLTFPKKLLGIATHNADANGWLYVTWFGKVNGVYTQQYDPANGPILYWDPVDGLFNMPIEAPGPKITIAVVLQWATGDAENGVILVRPDWSPNIYELSDVNMDTLKTTFTSTNKIMIQDETTGVWQPMTMGTFIQLIATELGL